MGIIKDRKIMTFSRTAIVTCHKVTRWPSISQKISLQNNIVTYKLKIYNVQSYFLTYVLLITRVSVMNGGKKILYLLFSFPDACFFKVFIDLSVIPHDIFLLFHPFTEFDIYSAVFMLLKYSHIIIPLKEIVLKQ